MTKEQLSVENVELRSDNKKMSELIQTLETKLKDLEVKPATESEIKNAEKYFDMLKLTEIRQMMANPMKPAEIQMAEILIRELMKRLDMREQEITALKNEAISDQEINQIHSRITELEGQNNHMRTIIQVVEAERNAISQALRIMASAGRIDPVMETPRDEMPMKSNGEEKLDPRILKANMQGVSKSRQ